MASTAPYQGEAAFTTQPQKFTRYKSVRKARSSGDGAQNGALGSDMQAVDAPPMPTTTAGLSRSMSRYKKPAARRQSSAGDQAPPIPMPLASAIPRAGDMAGIPPGRQAQNGTSFPYHDPTHRSAQHVLAHEQPQAPRRSRVQTDPSRPPRMSVEPPSDPLRSTRGITSPRSLPSQPLYVSPTAAMPMYSSYGASGAVMSDPTLSKEEQAQQILTGEKERQARVRSDQRRHARELERKKAAEAADVQKAEDERQMVAAKVEQARKKFDADKKQERAERRQTQRRLPLRSMSNNEEDISYMPNEDAIQGPSRRRTMEENNSDHMDGVHEIGLITTPYDRMAAPQPVPVRHAPVWRKPSDPSEHASPPPLTKQISAPQQPRASMSGQRPFVGHDAPVSASNSGQRHVTVTYNSTRVILDVDTTTTPVDLLAAASKLMPDQAFDRKTALILESFNQLGLERPLRRYERIRDVLNSWDHDRQNTLNIVPSVTNGKDQDLDASAVRPHASAPDTLSVTMYHSSRPGHWDKRACTLRSDGQVLVGKHFGVNENPEKEAKNVCHISDFDIYIPTPKQSKRLKAPKKLCFAIKSQNKPGMFINGENFVHFFCSKDREVAERWYEGVQRWRSWWLVERMGLGRDALETAQSPERAGSMSGAGGGLLGDLGLGRGTTAGASGGRRPSEGNNYQLGSFKPLLGDDLFSSLSLSKSNEPVPAGASMGSPERNGTGRRPFNSRGGPPVSFPTSLIDRMPPSDPGPFIEGGLLGSAYSMRQKQMQDAELEQGPFTNTGLLGRSYSKRQPGASPPRSRAREVESMDFSGTIMDTNWGRKGPLIDRI